MFLRERFPRDVLRISPRSAVVVVVLFVIDVSL